MSEGNGVMHRANPRFTRLEGHEVIFAWDMLFYAIKASELYSDDIHIINMLWDAAFGKYQCWLFRDSDGLKAVVLTKMFLNAGRKKLMVMHANTFEGGIDNEGWALVFKKLLQFGAGEHCAELEIFSESQRLKEVLRNLDFEEVAMFRKEITCPVAEQAAK